MMKALNIHWLLCVLLAVVSTAHTQSVVTADVRLRLAFPQQNVHPSPPAVLWLKPVQQASALPIAPAGQFKLLQRNRMFTPHLLVIPVGSEVLFPNADPFFHNVFSLFDGKRFDLGLYEAGSTKRVTFSREGISYIFCNIHPEMSAVVVALSTRFYAIADAKSSFEVRNVPAGDYDLHVWIEGVPQAALKELERRIHITAGTNDLGQLDIKTMQQRPAEHLNKFGRPYDREEKQSY